MSSLSCSFSILKTVEKEGGRQEVWSPISANKLLLRVGIALVSACHVQSHATEANSLSLSQQLSFSWSRELTQ